MFNVQYYVAKNIAKINCMYLRTFTTEIFLYKWPCLKIASMIMVLELSQTQPVRILLLFYFTRCRL